jgi:hypothetical protein
MHIVREIALAGNFRRLDPEVREQVFELHEKILSLGNIPLDFRCAVRCDFQHMTKLCTVLSTTAVEKRIFSFGARRSSTFPIHELNSCAQP